MIENVRRTDVKTCKRCQVEKLRSEFYRYLHKEARCKSCVSQLRKDKYQLNRPAMLTRANKYRLENPEKVRDSKLKQAYGVGIDYFNAKLKEQGGVCDGCKQNVKVVWKGKEVNMALDHDHITGAPRGVLCMYCNKSLGMLKENITTLLNLVDYIKKYQK